jgi:hypothetical protein
MRAKQRLRLGDGGMQGRATWQEFSRKIAEFTLQF